MLVKQRLRLAHTTIHDILGDYGFQNDRYLYLDRLLNMIFLCYLVPYNRLDPYTGHSDYRTVPARGFNLMDTANIQYGPRPYTVRLTALRPSPSSSPEIVLHKFRHSTLRFQEDLSL